MAHAWARPFYNSLSWIRTRDLYIQNRMLIDGGVCEECHSNPGYIVHHRIHLTEQNINDFDVSLNLENLEYVCKECHDSFEGHGPHGRGKAERLCAFDANGEVISLRECDLKRKG